MVLNFQIMDEMLSVVIKIKAAEHCFPAVQFILLFKVDQVGPNF